VVWSVKSPNCGRKAVKQLLLDKSLKHIEINGDTCMTTSVFSVSTMVALITKTVSVQVTGSGVDGSGR